MLCLTARAKDLSWPFRVLSAERTMSRFMRHECWRDALFLHYPVDAEALQQRLPPGLTVDKHDGVAYIGVVLLTESGIVPLPPGVPLWLVSCLGLSHDAVNVRTYVRPDPPDAGPPGIYFFTLDCSALLPTLGAHALFNLPYRYARMRRRTVGESHSLESSRVRSDVSLAAEWRPCGESLEGAEAALSRFFVERYALYNEPGPLLRLLMPQHSRLWAGTITHEPWPVQRARLIAYGGICSKSGVLSALGLSEIVQGGCIAHTSRGVGPVEFFWQGRAA